VRAAEPAGDPVGQPPTITDLLIGARNGAPGALDQLYPLVYQELRRIAHIHLAGERADHTLGTTGLVHDAYLKLVDQSHIQWQDRAHFYAMSSRAMRQILVSYARRHRAAKRGGGQDPITLDERTPGIDQRADNLLALDEALTRLESMDHRLSQVVECRFFGGLTEDETAEMLGVTARTVRRDWLKAKGWLYRELSIP
jgi:RNA polymerase sigma factor (TIGR02999 family)